MSNREKVLIKICHDILNSYENPESPNFSFVGKRINEGMYDDFLNAVETQYIVSDLSDLNYSSCLDWSITSRRDEKNKYGVSLSGMLWHNDINPDTICRINPLMLVVRICH